MENNNNQTPLFDWDGFTEIDLSYKSLDKLPSKTKVDLILKKHAQYILSSIHNFSSIFDILHTTEDIKSRASDLAESFAQYPNNARYKSEINSQGNINSLDIFFNMNNIRTEIPFGLEDLYVLALMLLNQALKIKGEESTIAAIEAVEVHGLAIARFHAYSIKEQDRSRRTKAARAKRHEKNNIVKQYAQKLAREVEEQNTNMNKTAIRDRILDTVERKASEVGHVYSVSSFPETVYKWVRQELS